MDDAGLWAIVGTIIGFFLFVIWDAWKDYKQKTKERKRIVTLLKTELLDNLDICRNSKAMLASDLKAIEETGTESVITPVSFSDSSWNISRSADILSFFTNDKLKKICELYSGFRMVNTVLANRDLTRATSKSLIQYPTIIKAYNYRLIEMISTLEAGITESIKILEAKSLKS